MLAEQFPEEQLSFSKVSRRFRILFVAEDISEPERRLLQRDSGQDPWLERQTEGLTVDDPRMAFKEYDRINASAVGRAGFRYGIGTRMH